MTAPLCTPPSREVVDPQGARGVLVLVGGVPGAGKSTLLARVVGRTGSRVLDPETHRGRLRAKLPEQVPYRCYRPLVHVLHAVATVALVLRGPSSGRTLLVHDPATRPRRRDLLGLLARRRGWAPVLVMLDVSQEEALRGQYERARVLRPSSFTGHWVRWTAERQELADAAMHGRSFGPWERVHLADRPTAPTLLQGLLRPDVTTVDR